MLCDGRKQRGQLVLLEHPPYAAPPAVVAGITDYKHTHIHHNAGIIPLLYCG